MVSKAIDKIRAEMAQKPNDDYVQCIGEFLIDYLAQHPEAASALLDEQKSIEKAIDAMEKEAEKIAVNGRARLTHKRGFEIVLNFFEVNGTAEVLIPNMTTALAPEKPKKVTTSVDFDINLDDLLR